MYGGVDSKSKVLRSFWSFNIDVNRWTELNNRGPERRAYSSLTPMLDGLALFGGLDDGNTNELEVPKVFGDLWLYKKGLWMRVHTEGTHPTPRFDHTAG